MYGQFDEVRIIKKIYEDYDLPKTCIEFGAYDGITNSNTYYFWNKKGFRSLLIEPDPNLYELLEKNSNQNCTVINDFVSVKNSLNKIIKKYNFPNKIGILSIDIDSNDLEIFKKIDHSSTFIVIIEFNNQFPVWVDYEDPSDCIIFRHSALAVLNYAKTKGYKLLDVKGSNLILINEKNLSLPDNLYPNSLENCFDYEQQKKTCKDIRIIGSKFTTNAKVFSQKPNILLRLKKYLFQLVVVINYSLRGKPIPSNKITRDCKKKILNAGLYL